MGQAITIPQSALTTTATHRFDSVDLLRGLIMIFMALDHTRDFVHDKALVEDPLNLATTHPLLFFTRWITHFCAPLFVFLAGTSAWFQSFRKTKKELSGFLVSRGLWLILMEITIVNFSFTFDIYFSMIGLQVIWAIGISMVILGLAIWLPFWLIFSIGCLIVFGHNTLDFYEKQGGNFSLMYDLLHRQTLHPLWKGHSLLILYPFLPWVGLMMLGYCFGKLFTSYEGEQRKKVLMWTGISIIIFFIALRATNLYGNPFKWSEQNDAVFTFLSFVNTHKYPPSLLFMCMTIGPGILFLAFAGKTRGWLARVITVYGRVPFFYYILHFFLIHFIAVVIYVLNGHSFIDGWTDPNTPFKFLIPGEGYPLWVVYPVWLFVVIALYPLCKWYSEYKRTHKHWWLSYL